MSRTERTYYLIVGSYNLSWAFVGAVYTIFLLDAGLDLFEINLVLATFFIASFLFEVPTGAVADLLGRKVSFVGSCIVRAGAFWLYFEADGLVDFLIAEAVDAVGQTLASGALDAWAVDGTGREKQPPGADRLLSRGYMVSHIAMLMSGLAGGYLGQQNLRIPWIAGTISFVVTGIIAIVWMRERWVPAEISGPPVRGGLVGHQVSRGLATVRSAPILRVLFTITAAAGFAQMPVLHYWPPYIQAVSGKGAWLLGWVWAFLIVLSIIASWLVPRLVARWGRGRVAAGAALLRGTSVLLAATAGRFAPGLGGLAGHSVGMSIGIPVVDAWVNDHVAERERATVLSISSMAFMFGGASGLIVLGLVARAGGIGVAWICSAVIYCGCALAYAAIVRAEEP